MAVNFTWEISALDLSKDVESYPDLVVTVHWRLKAHDDTDDLRAELYGADSLEPPQEGATFVPFSELTQEVVSSWIESKMTQEEAEEGVSRLQHLQGLLVAQIQDKRQPKMVTLKPPWQS